MGKAWRKQLISSESFVFLERKDESVIRSQNRAFLERIVKERFAHGRSLTESDESKLLFKESDFERKSEERKS